MQAGTRDDEEFWGIGLRRVRRLLDAALHQGKILKIIYYVTLEGSLTYRWHCGRRLEGDDDEVKRRLIMAERIMTFDQNFLEFSIPSPYQALLRAP
jgi:hypothetical protein